jgi:uncharacterized protein with NRDE domain
MCLTVFAYKVHPEYPLIFATNRDEFYDRPASKATFWYDNPTLLAGRDLKAGGTWMGITRNHRFAAITNFRDMNNIIDDAPSRGNIVSDYLTSDIYAQDYMNILKEKADLYNGYNLIAGQIDDLWYYSNQKDEPAVIEPGFHSLSNAFLDTPWPKTETALSEFKTVIKNNGSDENLLFRLLQNQKQYPDEQLPSTGLSIEMERLVSPIFITSEEYGTRCSTVIYANPDTETEFIEKTYKKGTAVVKETVRYRF